MRDSFDIEAVAAKRRSTVRGSRVSMLSIAQYANGRNDLTEEMLGLARSMESKAGLSGNEAVGNFVIACIGAGIVVFPSIMADNGIVLASSILIFSAGVCYECGVLILECCSLAEIVAQKQPGEVNTYEAVADIAFGVKGQMALAFTKNFYQLGTQLAYTVLVAKGLNEFLPGGLCVARWAIATPILVLLSMIPDLKFLAPVIPFGKLAVFVQCGAICFGSIWAGAENKPTHEVFPPISMDNIGVAISTFIFGFDAIVSLPCMRPQMANVEELPSALKQGMGIVVVVCLIVMACGYGGFGKAVEVEGVVVGGTQAIIIDSLQGAKGVPFYIGHVAAVGILINLLISCPLIFYTVTSYVESTGNDAWRTPMSPANIAFRASLMMSLIFVGSLISFAKTLIGLVSAVFGSCNSVFFPLVFFYSLRAQALKSDRREEILPISVPRKIMHGIVLVGGIVACVFGCIGGINSLMDALEHAKIGLC